MRMKPVYVGNDHGGCDLKREIAAHLGKKGIDVHDVGTGSADTVRYPYFAAEVARAILGGQADRGILVCSTGIGMSIIANKFRGIRAALCTSTFMARMTRAHNDSNVLCLGGKITAVPEALDILDTWLATPFDGGRHSISLDLIAEAEKAMIRQAPWEPSGPRL
jgi:ribose 5-phosphate isomerase B